MRPCGVIVLLSELFCTESKSQVYATLHEYFRRNPVASNNLGNQINTYISRSFLNEHKNFTLNDVYTKETSTNYSVYVYSYS